MEGVIIRPPALTLDEEQELRELLGLDPDDRLVTVAYAATRTALYRWVVSERSGGAVEERVVW